MSALLDWPKSFKVQDCMDLEMWIVAVKGNILSPVRHKSRPFVHIRLWLRRPLAFVTCFRSSTSHAILELCQKILYVMFQAGNSQVFTGENFTSSGLLGPVNSGAHQISCKVVSHPVLATWPLTNAAATEFNDWANLDCNSKACNSYRTSQRYQFDNYAHYP